MTREQSPHTKSIDNKKGKWWEERKPSTRGCCLDVPSNSQNYNKGFLWLSVRRINTFVSRIKGQTCMLCCTVTSVINVLMNKQRSNLIFSFWCHQELILLWNGFKVLHRRPDLVEPMLKLVQTSLVELEATKGKLRKSQAGNNKIESRESFLN